MKRIFFLVIITPLLACLLVLIYGVVNGLGCNYELKLPVEDNIESVAVCRWGRFNIVDTDLSSNDQWVASGINVSIANQMYIFVTKREKINDGMPGTPSALDKIHVSHDRIHLYHYAWSLVTRDQMFIFQQRPKNEIYTAHIDGQIDLWDYYIGYNPLVN